MHCLLLLYLVWCPSCLSRSRICNVSGSDLASWFYSHSHRRDVTSFCFFYKHFHGICSVVLFPMDLLLHTFKRATRLASRTHHFIVEIVKYKRHFYSNSTISRTYSQWDSVPITGFPDNNNLQKYKFYVNRNLLISLIPFVFCPFHMRPLQIFLLIFTLCNTLRISGNPAFLGVIFSKNNDR